MPSGSVPATGAGAGGVAAAGGGATGACASAVCADAATDHAHTSDDSRKPLITLGYTAFLAGLPQDTTLFEDVANGAHEKNRSGDAHGWARRECRVHGRFGVVDRDNR